MWNLWRLIFPMAGQGIAPCGQGFGFGRRGGARYCGAYFLTCLIEIPVRMPIRNVDVKYAPAIVFGRNSPMINQATKVRTKPIFNRVMYIIHPDCM